MRLTISYKTSALYTFNLGNVDIIATTEILVIEVHDHKS